MADESHSLLTSNNSPDVPFSYSINPYRGCEHGCAYCYARPSHEWLGMNAGIDFESKILVKHKAPELLRSELAKPNWDGQTIALSGNTDCYQPAERKFQLTRRCLEVLLETRQAVAIITKNSLVLRDLDLLTELASRRLVHVNLSLTTLDEDLARTMEPRTATPTARLRAIGELARAEIPVGVLIAPVVPGLTDHELPALLEAAQGAGAASAGYILLRLPSTVEPIFRDWLRRAYPDRADRIEALIRSTRDGRLSDSTFGRRMRGTGEYARQIQESFRLFARKFGLDKPLPPLDHGLLKKPPGRSKQLPLF